VPDWPRFVSRWRPGTYGIGPRRRRPRDRARIARLCKEVRRGPGAPRPREASMRRHRLPAGVLRRAVLCCCGAVLLLAAALGAQDWRRRWLTPPPDRQPDARGAFSFCRLFYTPVRREAGGQGWRTDYPLSDRHLMIRLSELTSTPVGWRDD